jgi:hypothetical protein
MTSDASSPIESICSLKKSYINDIRRLSDLESEVDDIIMNSAGLRTPEKNKLREWSEKVRPYDPVWPGIDKVNLKELTDSFIADSIISELVGILCGRWKIGSRTANDSRRERTLSSSHVVPADVRCDFFLDYVEGGSAFSAEKCIFVNDSSSHCDLADRFRDLMAEVYRERFDEAESFLLNGVNAKSFEAYFSSPNGFFASHLKRYSKGRRQAPIYWPLGTASGDYAVWVYYTMLTGQTLFTAVNDFVEPKLQQVAEDIATLRQAGLNRGRQEERRLESLVDFEVELAELRDTLLAIAPSYKPDQDDGVQITAAPLWQLFRHTPWRKILNETWDRLERGDYDWAKLAMAYWPERVREKCVTDRSLAIAHDLEHLYEPPATETGKKGKNK